MFAQAAPLVSSEGPMRRLPPPTPFRSNHYRQVCSFDAKGAAKACRRETDFLQIEDDTDKTTLALGLDFAVKLAGRLKDKVDLEALELVVDSRFYPNGDNAWKSLGKAAGDFLLDRSVQSLTVAADGRISMCRVVERGLRPRADLEQECRRAIGVRFEPDSAGSIRSGRQVHAVYFRSAMEAVEAPAT